MLIIKYALCGNSLNSQREAVEKIFNDLFFKYFNISNAYSKIIKDANGKPFINGVENGFSISHSKGLCAVALCVDKVIENFSDNIFVVNENFDKVGIDVQPIPADDKICAYKKIAEKYFSAQENLNLLSCNSSKDFLEAFVKLWTIKESFCKMNGFGLKFIRNAVPENFDDIYINSFKISNAQKQYFISFCGKKV